ncbi:MAG: prephenate dehydratase [Gammaproteobacteria bacterium]
MSEKELREIRKRIDTIDVEIQQLISQRAECALEIANHKNAQSGGEGVEYYRPEREAEIIRAVIERNDSPLDDEIMVGFFREIMSACRALQYPLNIAYLGPEGTFTQAAVVKHFGSAHSTTPLMSIDEVFREVESGAAQFGVVPIENSTEGMVNHTLDIFLNSPLKICSEIELRIHHNLLSTERELGKVQCIYAHQQALAQCREWLDANVVDVKRIVVNSNAEAARLASSKPGAAAIAGSSAAEIYELGVLAKNIEDESDNTTRFLVISRRMPSTSKKDKTSLLLSAPNKPGALYRLLKPFANNNISMTRIESRPSRRGMWDYVFFVDIEGHIKDEKIANAVKELEADTYMVKVLGSYPRATS